MSATPRIPADRQAAEGLRARLLEAPGKFSFVQLTRLLHVFYGPKLEYEQFLRTRVRIRAHLSLAFPPRDVVALTQEEDADGEPRFLLTVSPLGLYGASSPLPTFYVEDLLDEARADRSAGRDFLDIVNRVFYELFLCGGWFRYHPMRAVQEQRDQAFSEQLLALAGLGEAALREGRRDALSLASFAGLLSQFPRSAAGLQAFLSGLFRLRCRIRQCVPRQAAIPADQRCMLGASAHQLGETAVLGQCVDDATGKLGILLQELDYRQFTFLTAAVPGQNEVLRRVDFYCTEPLEADIHLVMRAGLARGARLGDGPPEEPFAPSPPGSEACRWQCLGRDTWLGDGPVPVFNGRNEDFYPEGAGMAVFIGQGRYAA